MKKRVLSMLMVMIMMVSLLSVSVFAHDGACVDADNNCVCDTEGCGEAVHAWDNGTCTKCSTACSHTWLSDDSDAICKACGLKHSHNLVVKSNGATGHYEVCEGCPVDATKQYNVSGHNLVANGSVNECDVCGYTEHIHSWNSTWNYDDSNHWHECVGAGCAVVDNSEKDGFAAHTWKEDSANSSATNKVYNCACGATKNEHKHVWSKTWSESATHHWHACTDPSCGEVTDLAEHFDTTSNGNCDDCTVDVAPVAHTSLTITDLTEPANGAAVDFNVNIAEGNEYGKVTVKWNKVTKLSTNESVALGTSNTYSAGEMYNTSITVLTGGCDTFDNFTVTLNGINVPFYKTYAAFEAAAKTYEGDNTVYMAYRGMANGETFIRVCAMYAKLPGTHTHTYGSEWIETPAKHYYMCTGCEATKDAAYHYDNNNSGLCDVCGFDMKYFNKNATATSTGSSSTGHTHTYSTDWVEDISNHWKQCTGCGAVTQKAAHADLNNTNKCDVCGFVMKAEDGHTHTFASDWTETFAQHYKVCTCGAKNEIAAHVDLNNTGKCDTCGYAMTTLSNNGIVADTGDENATFLWMAALAFGMVGAAVTVVFARKKREE